MSIKLVFDKVRDIQKRLMIQLVFVLLFVKSWRYAFDGLELVVQEEGFGQSADCGFVFFPVNPRQKHLEKIFKGVSYQLPFDLRLLECLKREK